jgi:hypothetical protein
MSKQKTPPINRWKNLDAIRHKAGINFPEID